ncbi:MAG: restriction endonuclease subunit S [Pirellulaceae bacterium]|nr:restriction endonuclease subunit S [Pirellulaceae bacterium]
MIRELAAHSAWQVDRIKDHVWKIGSGVTPSGGAASYLDAGIPLLRSQNVHFDGLRLDDVAFIAEETHEEMSGSKLRARDVLLNITGASIGRCAFVPDGFGEGNVNQHVCIIRPAAKLNHKFLTYCLSAPWGQDQIFSGFTGASRQGLGQRDLGEIQVPLPPLPEQQRIAAYLDASCAAIDAAVAAKRRQLETLDELGDAVIHQAVTRGLDARVKMRPSGIDWLPEIPDQWRPQQIKRNCEIVRGKFTHRPRNDPAFYDGEYPFVQTGDITAARKYIRTYSQTLNELGFSVSKMFPRGTLVMSIAANIGDVAILDFEACFPDSMVGLIPGPKTDLTFLYYMMRAMKSIMLRSAVISTQLNLNNERIGANFAAFPPVREQKAIAEFLDAKEQEIDSMKEKLNQQINTLTAYRKSLIHECVTGQRRVTEADLKVAGRA